MDNASTALAQVDPRPFFEKALCFGLDQGLLSPAHLQNLLADGPKGIVQIANFFGTAHLRPELENARRRMVNLASLYLEDLSDGDLRLAALSLRDKTFLAHSKGGSEMLKRLHAMPAFKIITEHRVSAENQRDFLNDHSLASALSLADYRAALAERRTCQREIDFAQWLAKKLGVPKTQIDAASDTEADMVFRSAMLAVFVAKAPLRMPSRSGFVRLVEAAKNKRAKLDEARLDGLLKDAPPEFQQLGRKEMLNFIGTCLPEIRNAARTADSLLYGESSLPFFVVEDIDEDNREYEKLVAKEWHRITDGEDDDPAVVSTVFLLVATGFPPKSKLLLREAKEIIRVFRTSGFDSRAVVGFVEAHAPHQIRDDMKSLWLDDLLPEAEVRLADSDPQWPDTHLERALDYVRKTCRVAWKGRNR